MSTIDSIDLKNDTENMKILGNMYLQISLNPIKFTLAGFYKINLNLYAAVNMKFHSFLHKH